MISNRKSNVNSFKNDYDLKIIATLVTNNLKYIIYPWVIILNYTWDFIGNF
jgi:hypothetical protein